jgi:protein-tyrosine-phosphatase
MFDVESNLLAHHLQVLEEAGLVARSVSHGDRRRRYVRLTPQPLAGLLGPRLLAAAGVVFVCTANSARSQLAAALWNDGSPIPAASAGTDPAERVHPEAVRAARRHGVDLSDTVPRRFESEQADDLLVVTVCDVAHEQLATRTAGPRPTVLHWSVADPALSDDPEAFDATVAELADRVELLRPVVVAP